MKANDFPKCATCAHWHQYTEEYGSCRGAIEDEIKHTDSSDNDLHLYNVSTKTTFGCINHSSITDNDTTTNQ